MYIEKKNLSYRPYLIPFVTLSWAIPSHQSAMVLHEDHPSIGAFPVLLVVGDDAQGILQVLPYHPPQRKWMET